MKTLQESLDQYLQEAVRPEKLGPEFVRKRLKSLGVELTESQLAKIKSQFINLEKNGLHFEFEDDQVVKAGFKSEKEFRDALKTLPDDLVSDLEKFSDEFFKSLPSNISKTAEELSKNVLEDLKRDSKRMLKDRKKEISRFESNLYKVWGKAFDLLQMFIVISLEAGEKYNYEFKTDSTEDDNYVLEVMARLHARACQIASEILALIKSGHADGAHARWRSLHEVSVVALFISTNGNELAERYLLYDNVESYKAATIYQEHCEKLGYEPLTKEELNEIKEIYDNLIDRFGKNYRYDYGWASSAIGKNKPSFRDIEKVAGLKHLRPYYKMACHNVHANPRGLFFKLGLYPESGDILLAGPSNVGMADPGHSTALSLAQITVSLLTHQPNLDRLVICQILMKLEKEIGEAFMEAARSLMPDKSYN
jgi:hypothetical protein